MIRLFVGIQIPENASNQLILIQNGLPEARWVAPDNMHITLRFIGEVDENVAEDLAKALEVVRVQPYALSLVGVGTFGRPPHSLWAGVKDHPQGTLTDLHRTIDGVLIRAGLEPEHRKYQPHVTLARFRRGAVSQFRFADYLEAHADLKVETFEGLGFTLFESVITHRGPMYNPLIKYHN
ncbi:RNA 2',3'-cyclic phosphodiesterase [Magnetovibrio sp. PR-2]|uniref:RNA 2',3'-cyclic phosphodiesterase n=1 Tax=Magnetovibrio sp. PR-2 TaxID=3120356 RepID=UPI002FCDECA2